ncbi:hypothetical protein T4E_7195 [Trichinella pseudospiralis]|uniref:Uncharacterized protein n=1 Tax=Trichinella pseudospiralis TaxID=6337 RepID=A0A0V0YKN7_TRIPS|nr:hypothetical protein T4E_7195 [Trichinella pseudospiralis]
MDIDDMICVAGSEMKKFHFFANCIGPDECMKSLQWIATIESNHKQN